jgi:hypothetical protein
MEIDSGVVIKIVPLFSDNPITNTIIFRHVFILRDVKAQTTALRAVGNIVI